VPNSTTAFAPLPVPTANIKRIRRTRPTQPQTSPAALIPLFYASLCFLAGIAFARYQYLRPGYLLLSLIPIAAIAILALTKAPRVVWMPLAFLWFTLGILALETEPTPTPNSAVTDLSDGLLRTVEGEVVNAGPQRARNSTQAPEDSEPDTPREHLPDQTQLVDLQLTTAEVITDTTDTLTPIPNPITARIRLTVIANPSAILCGQHLRAVIRMLPPDTFRDPGVWSSATWLESQQISALATINALQRDGQVPGLMVPRLTLLNQPAHPSLTCLVNRLRNQATARLETLPQLTHSLPSTLRATPSDAAMLTALLTGDRTYLTRGLRTGFERTGSFHLIVVSGLHLAILAGCIFALSRRLPFHRLAATALTLAVTLAYAVFTGSAIPAQRSFWMIALYLLGRLFYRSRSPLNVIGFAVIAIAAASPRSVFEASLQMTVLSVTSIAGIALPLLERTLHARLKATQQLRLISLDPKLPPFIAQFRVTLRLIARHLAPISRRIAWRIFPLFIRSTLRLAELLFITLVVELALALPMALYFHRITVYALPVNLCILPLLAILVPTAMLMLAALMLWPAATVLPAALCLAILHANLWIIHKLGSLSLGDLRIPDPSSIQIAIALVLFVLAIQLARATTPLRRVAFLALSLMAIAALWPRPIDHPSNALLFEAIDVGQGDSILLITPDGKSLLVDAGGLGFLGYGSRGSQSEFDVGEEVVSPALWSRGIRHLDAVALTHAHHDHMGGLPAILRNFHPRELWVGNNPPAPAYLELLADAAKLNIRVRSFHAGESISLGDTPLRVLAPSSNYQPGREPSNNDSLVLQARYQSASILLAGDAEAPEEQAILSESNLSTRNLSSSVLKVGHHGSLTSTRPAFLSALAPQWAVISCGRRNRFGHPRHEILAELQAAHVHTFRTDANGATCLYLNGNPGVDAVSLQPLCSSDFGELHAPKTQLSP
jgi:competence protein ComEC